MCRRHYLCLLLQPDGVNLLASVTTRKGHDLQAQDVVHVKSKHRLDCLSRPLSTSGSSLPVHILGRPAVSRTIFKLLARLPSA